MRTPLIRAVWAALLGVVLAFAPSARAGHPSTALRVDNDRALEVLVLVDRAWVGSVPAHGQRSFPVSPGRHTVELRARDGQTLLQSALSLRPGEQQALRLAPLTGTLRVDNRAGTPLELRVDGRSMGTVAIGELRPLSLAAGTRRVELRYVQLGRDRVLESRTLDLQPGRSATLVAEPVGHALVQVENRTGRAATLRVDGLPAARLGLAADFAPDQARELVLPLGRHELVLVDARSGVELDRLGFTAVAYRDHRWSAVAPRVGDLVVDNPLPMAVRVVIDGRPDFTLGAGQVRRVEDLPVGSVRVAFQRTAGETIAALRAEVRPFEDARLRAPVPTDGVVELVNRSGAGAVLRVDGRTLAVLAPGEQRRFALGLGEHRVELLDDRGRRLEARAVWVDRYSDARLELGAPALSCSGGGDHRGHGHAEHRHGDDGGERDEDRRHASASGWHQRP